MLEEGDANVQRPLTTDVDKKLREIILERFYIFVKVWFDCSNDLVATFGVEFWLNYLGSGWSRRHA